MSKSNSGLFKGTKGYNVYSGSTDYMDKDDSFSKFIKKRKDIDENGYYDFIAHGTENTIQVRHNGKLILVDHRTAAKLFKQDSKYPGEAIRLISCDTGSSANGFAQSLANKLNVIVEAPTKPVWVTSKGKHFVADRRKDNPDLPDLSRKGKFIKFYPGGKKK